jgi:hypothetical protein
LDRWSDLPKGAVIAVALGIALAVAGCGLFEPREPKVAGVAGERCRNLTEPDSLVANILVHYGKLAGTACYNSMVDTAFTFTPDPGDLSDTPTKYDGWNRDVETRVAINIAADAAFIETVFDSSYQDPTITTSPLTETRYYAYHILIQEANQPDTTRYQGRADIKFQQQGTSLYTIVAWSDRRDGSGLPTWGRLRGDKRVGF